MNKLLRLLGQLERHPLTAKNTRSTNLDDPKLRESYPQDFKDLLEWIDDLVTGLTITIGDDGKQALVNDAVKALFQKGYQVSLMPEGNATAVTLHTKKGLYQYAYI